jgi:hypothetical protein
MPLDAYEEFVRSKLTTRVPTGIADPPKLGSYLAPFQADLVRWCLQRGRAALFADTGLGKTRAQLEWARVVAEYTSKPVLILAPLAVTEQTAREGAELGIPVKVARSHAAAVPWGITITNYDMLDHFDASAFGAVVLDESSILKNFMGATKRKLLEAFRDTPFKLCASATPAPNDYLELGNHAEFLGVLTSHEMIARWFINDTSTFGTYRLKGHAVEPFFDWVSSWARCVGKPSDVDPSYDDTPYVLPGLDIRTHVLEVNAVEGRADGELFRDHKLSAANLHREKRLTLALRAAKVAELVRAEPDEPWCLWCETDYEADAIREALPEATDLRGSMTREAKTKVLLGFIDGSVRYLITKPKLAGQGLNLQCCARTAYVAPSFSYESDYQSLRRFHRFGQKRVVVAHYVMGHTEIEVWSVMLRKAKQHEAMKAEMFAAMRRSRERVDNRAKEYEPKHVARVPAWLTSERRAA